MIVKGGDISSKNENTTQETLRPRNWEDYIGQAKLKEGLRIIIDAAKTRKEPIEHLLLYGNSGLGKTTLAHVIAHEMGTTIRVCSAPSLEKAGDIASLLSNLQEGEVLFIDECHRLNNVVMEALYSAMEDFTLHLILGKGPLARTMDLQLPHFTLIGATTKLAQLSSPFRNRFGATLQLNFYQQGDIEQIVARSAVILNTEITQDAISSIAERSRYTPRVANRILKRVRDFATIEGGGAITKEIAEKAFHSLEIDELGLEPGDRKILDAIIHKFSGGPVGIQALAATVAEEQETILDVYEPYLLQLGFIERTPRGRIVTSKARSHLGISKSQKGLV